MGNNITLFHGSSIKGIDTLKIIDKHKINDLGYGIYVAYEDFAERYTGEDGAIYQVIVKLKKELSLADKTIDVNQFAKLSNMLLSKEDLYYALSDYKEINDEPSIDEVNSVLQIIYNDCENDKDFFNQLYRIEKKFLQVFEALRFTHTYSEHKGEPEWCLLPHAIVTSQEIKK